MLTDGKRFNKEIFAPYFAEWEAKRGTIEALYGEKDERAVDKMREAIAMYEGMLALGGVEIDARSGREVYRLSPLNGTERLEFVKAKLASHYAFVQLDALFGEMKKKVARLALQDKRK
ncbi:YpoC family protein [Sporosarcina sp. 179-K 3D1 HS]|uniref:YpoC family protein n=1 Tax=Sporosarcina sp. 179-K 3D1 HS TaxID=3232169 RepID=UPI00399EF180